MKKYFPVFVWWCGFVVAWSVYRSFQVDSEVLSELLVKPILWLGSIAVAVRWRLLPVEVLKKLRIEFLRTKPMWLVFLLPFIGILGYFFAINAKSVLFPEFSIVSLMFAVIVNFSTGLVEEVTYRGVLYVWLLSITDELSAFLLVQGMFVVAHIPTLYLNSDSLQSGLVHIFFIVLIGAVHTGVFRATKSLYASVVTHGTWNTLVHYLLVGV